MRFDIVTLFPNMFDAALNDSILQRAQKKDLLEFHFWNPRDFSEDKHNKVDDIPFGGGGGMLMACQPLFDCMDAIKKQNSGPVFYMSPRGVIWKQELCEEFSEKYDKVILVCGRYEGIDQRFIDTYVDKEISIGEYVLTGGEIASMVLIDSISRLVDGVIEKHSHEQESFSKAFDRKKEYPHYTRPADFRGMEVPKVLLSGNHAAIEQWRKDNLE